jgi:hypothetical protein
LFDIANRTPTRRDRYRAVALHAHAASLVASQSNATISLAGSADGYDTPTQSSHGSETRYHPTAGGTIQHTHIVPVHSYHIDLVTGLHLLSVP